MTRTWSITVGVEMEAFICSLLDDTTLMAESEEELKRLLMKVKEESEKLA